MNRLSTSLFAASTLLIAACGSGTTGPTASPTSAPTSAPASPAPAPPAPAPSTAAAPYPAGLSEQQITVDGVARQYRVHVPAALEGVTVFSVKR